MLVGAAARDALMSFHPRALLSRQQRITGCIYGSARPHEDLPTLLRWCADGHTWIDQGDGTVSPSWGYGGTHMPVDDPLRCPEPKTNDQ